MGFSTLVGGVVTGTTVLMQASTVPHPVLDTYTVSFEELPASATIVTTFSGNIGCEGSCPTLHVGGVHDAITVAPPPLALAVTDPPVTLTDPGCDELQVRGEIVFRSVVPEVSTTMGMISFEVGDVPVTCS
jgi:hypothetical protein